jgi:hypothetical protein
VKLQPDRKPVPAVVQAAQELGAVITMTRDEAEAVTTSDGKTYGGLTTSDLKGREHGINQAMKKPGVTEKALAEGTRKLQAIGIILAAREKDLEVIVNEVDDEYARQAENE